MKKNLITLMTITAILASGFAAFAANDTETVAADAPAATLAPETTQAPEEDIMLISEAPAISASYISNTVTVTAVTDNGIETTLDTEDAENPENTINFTVSDDTVVLDSVEGEKKELSDIKTGDTITVFTSIYAPAPLILPPQYQADVIVINNAEIDSLRFFDVDTYVKNNDTLVNLANTLALNLNETVKIADLEGKEVKAEELENKDLAVIYLASTKSIPAQTTPIAVVVLGENEKALEAIEAVKAEVPEATEAPETSPEATEAPEDFEVDFSKIKTVTVGSETITNIYTNEDGTLMLPLRKIAETLGITVDWDGENRAVMLNQGMFSLKIGENSYIKGKMMPQSLSTAPEITNDLTYVPVDYFMDIIETELNLIEGETLELVTAEN